MDVKLPKGSHVLPLGVLSGRNLKSSVWWEKMEALDTPAHFFFGWAKHDVTHQKIEQMKEVHMDKLKWCGNHCRMVLKSIEDFLAEVTEDFSMSGSFESLMPSAPPLSHLYLKHCEGRELAEDAATPRSDDLAESEEEDDAFAMDSGPHFTATATLGQSSEMQQTMDRSLNQSMDPAAMHSGAAASGAAASGAASASATASMRLGAASGRRRRLERNSVLTQTKAAASAKAAAR